MPYKLLSTLLLLALLAAAGCSPAPIAISTASSLVPQVSSTASTSQTTLTVLAAASLTEVFTSLGQMFEAIHPGVKVALDFAGSQQLEQQLSLGAPADVFASASTNYMDAAVSTGRVNSASVKDFAQNRLVVIFPIANPAGIKTLQDLAKPNLKLDLADKSVPVGNYSQQFLSKASQDPAFGSSFQGDVLKNVVSFEDNVKTVVTKVALGEADAGICYSSDITRQLVPQLGKLSIPDTLNVLAVYPIAPLSDSAHLDLANAFIDLVLSPKGQSVLNEYGFISK